MDTDPQPEIREKRPFLRERQQPAVREAQTAVEWWPKDRNAWARLCAWMLAPGVFLAVLGPFGSFAAPFWMNLAYWVPTMGAGAIIGWIVTAWADRQSFLHGRAAVRLGLVTAIITFIMCAIVVAWGWVIYGANRPRFGPELIVYVWVVSCLMYIVGTVVMRAWYSGPARPLPEPAPAPLSGTPRPAAAVLTSRLKPDLRGAAILALEAEDHYVRIHTDRGSDLVLMRLADAILEMGNAEGARAHRSWWVARAAIAQSRRADGRGVLTLVNGIEVPVSRSAMSSLAEMGWL